MIDRNIEIQSLQSLHLIGSPSKVSSFSFGNESKDDLKTIVLTVASANGSPFVVTSCLPNLTFSCWSSVGCLGVGVYAWGLPLVGKTVSLSRGIGSVSSSKSFRASFRLSWPHSSKLEPQLPEELLQLPVALFCVLLQTSNVVSPMQALLPTALSLHLP